MLTALSFIADTIILITGIGIQFDNGHSNTNIKVLSVTSVIAAFIAELILGFASGTKPAIVIVIGVVLLVYLLVLYLFPKSKI